jgi:hypothetical protein
MQNAWETKAPEQIKEEYTEGIACNTSKCINAKKNHDMAPNFSLTGKEVGRIK